MNISLLLDMQDILDKRIMSVSNIKKMEQVFEEKLLALIVEIGELSNVHKSFKYWKSTPSTIDHEELLFEYVDGFHFFLSLGNQFRFKDLMKRVIKKENYIEELNITTITIHIINDISHFYQSEDEGYFCDAFAGYLKLGELLGISHEDIEQAYVEKNQENHRRQDNGY